ncbi:short-chain dehydrogenase/reductase [Sulfurimicrobium lacus]|uniref:Short-chain dehydrogenase/reductase n=1 Tax=Sulfurimicrobium lacus TaxID=2715678 RepID=A0A6F8VAG1_9PROT|nr:SDR family NAD(P)-dependent oxidoreductase [Sulfurimicrobium lacus]BCB25745.1 short-chain dehydrogenase/reductase [Sulfurimicrobium lacus]
MEQKSVLITGCSSGIGLCAAEGLARRGFRVFATARQAADVEMLAARGLESLQLDIADSDSIRRAVDEVLHRTGGTLYALFNNAGYGQPGAVEDLRREVLREQFETNVFGTVELTNRIIPVMRAQGGGRIVINSSILGYIALPFRGAYNASKFALEGIADTLRLELRGSGIHVSLIEPGPITSRFRANAHEMFKQRIDAEASFFRDTYRAMENRLTKPGPAAPFTLPPEAVLEKLIHALESGRPRIRYPVTFPAHLFAVLKRVLSGAALDSVLGRVGKDENR